MSELSALIIEDDREVAQIYELALRLAGYKSEIIVNGRDAGNRLQKATPILVLLDLHLPEVSGQELLAQMKADARLQETRVIVTTADPLLAEQIRDEVDLVLIKPVSVSQLTTLSARMKP